MVNLIKELWNEATGKAALERELARFRESVVRARDGEAPRPEDMVLYLMHNQPRDDHGRILISPFVQTLMRKCLGMAEEEYRRRRDLKMVADDLSLWAERIKNMPHTSLKMHAASKRIRLFLEGMA